MKAVMWKPSRATLAAVKAEDVCRVALAAYYAAARGVDLGERDTDGEPWRPGDEVMDADEFALYLHAQLQARLVVFGRSVGVEFPYQSLYEFEHMYRKVTGSFAGPDGNGLPCEPEGGKDRPQGVLGHG